MDMLVPFGHIGGMRASGAPDPLGVAADAVAPSDVSVVGTNFDAVLPNCNEKD